MPYCIDPSADEPIMMLDRHIGMDMEDGMGIDGAAFAQEVLQLDRLDKKSIQVYINCPGGSVIDGMNIYSAILKSNTPVDTHNVGIAASMGGVCFMAGRKRFMADYASLMLHNPSGGDDKKTLDSMVDSLTTMLAAKSGITKEDVGYLMTKTTWLNSAECFAKGFATEITPTNEQNKKRMPATAGARALWKTATDIVNNAFQNTNDMKKVTAKLNLVEGASEDAVVGAITKMENDISTVTATAKADRERLEGELATAKADLKTASEKATKLEADLKIITDKAALEATTAVTEKATTMVTAFAKVGRIKNDAATIKGWVDLAIANFDGTKKMIEDLPLNKVANTIETVADNADAIKSSGTAAGIMHSIENKLKGK